VTVLALPKALASKTPKAGTWPERGLAACDCLTSMDYFLGGLVMARFMRVIGSDHINNLLDHSRLHLPKRPQRQALRHKNRANPLHPGNRNKLQRAHPYSSFAALFIESSVSQPDTGSCRFHKRLPAAFPSLFPRTSPLCPAAGTGTAMLAIPGRSLWNSCIGTWPTFLGTPWCCQGWPRRVEFQKRVRRNARMWIWKEMFA